MMALQKVDLDGKIEQIATLNGEIQCEECTEIREHLVMQLFQSLGLTDKTLLNIEMDLREQQARTKAAIELKQAVTAQKVAK